MVELPESQGFDVIMNVVDSTGKCAHFVPTHTTVTVEGAACLFLNLVWKLHGLHKVTICD